MTVEERRESSLRLSGYLQVWRSSLAQQRERLRSQGVLKGGPDTWLYIVALGAGLRCVGLAETLGAEVADARARFDSLVPDAKHVRDVIEHLEDYELGVCDQQVGRSGSRLEFLWCSSSQGVEYLELQGVGLHFDLAVAHAAALELLDAATAALHDVA
ncbi:MAG: hypothetical protein QOJ79_2063 [Actinomycetota bacterium]|nr:hypothetical protein [Actinomycetota bacterium]